MAHPIKLSGLNLSIYGNDCGFVPIKSIDVPDIKPLNMSFA